MLPKLSAEFYSCSAQLAFQKLTGTELHLAWNSSFAFSASRSLWEEKSSHSLYPQLEYFVFFSHKRLETFTSPAEQTPNIQYRHFSRLTNCTSWFELLTYPKFRQNYEIAHNFRIWGKPYSFSTGVYDVHHLPKFRHSKEDFAIVRRTSDDDLQLTVFEISYSFSKTRG